ncbi:G5 domain-containing protein [Candidatus Saccharibacteria bacterium]|nr:G5 domain-containing protein [Candidatus Saccharibacteria bacterium]
MRKTGVYWLLGILAVAVIGISNITTTENIEVKEPINYTTRITYDANVNEGVREVRQAGKNGSKKVVYEVAYRNNSEVSRKKLRETVVESSVDEEVVIGTKKYTPTPTPTPTPTAGSRIGAICRDGWRSSATGRGACSHHGGVAQWLYN